MAGPALASAVRPPVFVDLGYLSESVLGNGEDEIAGFHDGHTDRDIVIGERYSPHTHGVPSRRPDLRLVEPCGLTVLGRDDYLIPAVGYAGLDDLVALIELDGLDPFVPDVAVGC